MGFSWEVRSMGIWRVEESFCGICRFLFRLGEGKRKLMRGEEVGGLFFL